MHTAIDISRSIPRVCDTPAIEARGLGRDYGSTRALDTLDLAVPAGSMVGLLGPNGAGKTTAMLLLATLLRPSRGVVQLFGHDGRRARAAIRRRLGLVFQEPSIDGLLTVEENLLFAGRLMGLDGAEARRTVDETLARTGLKDHAARPARTLSTGWRRLADLARALLHGPDLLILDEPTVGLDPEHRERAWRLIEAERSARNTTILFSTHYLGEAERSDRVVLLARGREVAAGTPAALKATLGDEILEIEGPSAASVIDDLRHHVDIRLTFQTETGYRVGVKGAVDALARGTALAGSLRFAVRPVTLEDVYFARTQQAPGVVPSGTTGQPA